MSDIKELEKTLWQAADKLTNNMDSTAALDEAIKNNLSKIDYGF